ncbi:threonine dehydratase, mitochondrial [[Candida] jaroonii]|uniref:Threonine dehydratase, mitochondrial n=1 Tax=[Candida] jaroonii TaxID=467808 RepID=A0ACA9Y0Z5_9ASCO|nr:threonine dehydratase, mitochondrial [[Candida] jaroonii]
MKLLNTSYLRLLNLSSRPQVSLHRYFSDKVKHGLEKYPELNATDLDSEGNPDYVKLILTSKVYDVVQDAGSPLTHAVNLSQKLGTNVYLKREDLLPVFSFKLRGAYNMIANLHANPNKKLDGVIACSAGNHAQGVAFSANKLGIPSVIVMPTATPSIKYKNVSRLGSQVVLYGEDFDSAKSECDRLSIVQNLTNIPPFNHPYVIAGQGTIALELTRQLSLDKLDAVFVPVGGGGLISGVAAYLKKVAPHVKIIGVETFDADALKKSHDANHLETLHTVGAFADGTAVKVVGEECWRLCKDLVDDIILVSTDELCAAIKDIFEDTRSIVEPSGALSVAGMKKYVKQNKDIDHKTKSYIPILSGANMNFDRLRFVSERAVLGEGKEASLVVSIPERPGEFSKLQSIIDPRSITEFSYRYNNNDPANIFVSFNVTDKENDLKDIIDTMRSPDYGYEVHDISDNEVAKSHGRYLIGGNFQKKPNKIVRERVYEFEFPERPGALFKFLNTLKPDWDITLFNYRNHGNDVAKVLCGIVTPEETLEEDFQAFLKTLGYRFSDETDNIIYKKFLS